MTYRLDLEIAGITLSMFSDDSLILRDGDASYLDFIKRDAAAATDVSIDLVRNTMPDTAQLARLFESEQSWTMFEDRDDYVMSFAPPAFYDKPACIVRFDRQVTAARVYCGEIFCSAEKGERAFLNPVRYPVDQILLMHALAKRGGAVLHAAGAVIGDKGCVFPGRSGAGKTTISRQFIGRQDIEILSDDRMIARKVSGRFRMFGTPWPGEAGIALNKSAPLSGMFFLCQSAENAITAIPPREAVKKLFPVVSIPWYDHRVVSDMLDFLEDLVEAVPAYELHFKRDGEVSALLAEFMENANETAEV